MLLKLLFLCVLVTVDAAFEGDTCSANGNAGTCIMISKCRSAIEGLKKKKNPQTCGFKGSEPIVCCLDNSGGPAVTPSPPPPIATTTKKPVQTSTTEYVPPEYYYKDINSESQCEPIDPESTSKKTGQKAFDKCLEYQDKYVYPCERSVSLTGGMSRGNKCRHNALDLVLGGVDARQYEFPHMVMLGYGDDPQSLSWLCGGTIISERFILTAGHCITSNTSRLGLLTHVLVGALTRSDAENEANRYKVKRIISHPDYNPPSKYNDIALVETENPIKLSQYIVPACLDVANQGLDDRVLATGWGLTEYKGNIAEIMQKVILHKFSTAECSTKYPVHRLMKIGFDPETQTCYGDRTEVKDTCQGDSGGPLQINSKKINCMYVTVGVTSFGRACGFPGEPAIYTRVAHYVPWIESIVWP